MCMEENILGHFHKKKKISSVTLFGLFGHSHKAENFICNWNNTVLLFLTNNTITREKVISRVVALLIENDKKCYFHCMKVFLIARGYNFLLFGTIWLHLITTPNIRIMLSCESNRTVHVIRRHDHQSCSHVWKLFYHAL